MDERRLATKISDSPANFRAALETDPDPFEDDSGNADRRVAEARHVDSRAAPIGLRVRIRAPARARVLPTDGCSFRPLSERRSPPTPARSRARHRRRARGSCRVGKPRRFVDEHWHVELSPPAACLPEWPSASNPRRSQDDRWRTSKSAVWGRRLLLRFRATRAIGAGGRRSRSYGNDLLCTLCSLINSRSTLVCADATAMS